MLILNQEFRTLLYYSSSIILSDFENQLKEVVRGQIFWRMGQGCHFVGTRSFDKISFFWNKLFSFKLHSFKMFLFFTFFWIRVLSNKNLKEHHIYYSKEHFLNEQHSKENGIYLSIWKNGCFWPKSDLKERYSINRLTPILLMGFNETIH